MKTELEALGFTDFTKEYGTKVKTNMAPCRC